MKTTCKNGHDLSKPESWYLRTHKHCNNGMQRICIACERDTKIRRVSGMLRARERARSTHCRRGHEMTPENTYVFPNGQRTCRTCKTAATRQSAARGPGRRKPTGIYEAVGHGEVTIDPAEALRTIRILDLQEQIERETVSWLREDLRRQMAVLVAEENAARLDRPRRAL